MGGVMAEGNDGLEMTARDTGTIGKYRELKHDVLGCIDEMAGLEAVAAHRHACVELREKIRTDAFNLVVVGQFKRGKTCLINALLGADILPVAVVPLTSIVTVLTFGESLGIRIIYNDGTVAEAEPERLAEFVTETGNPKNVKDVREVLITYPSDYLKDGVRLIDTPGVGSVYLHNTDVAYQYLPKSDAALFLFSVEQPASKAELDFLRDVQSYSDKIFFLLNKIDYLSESEILESISFAVQVIREAMGSEIRIFPISAKLALQGKRNGDGELLEKSRLPGFTEVLERFLLQEKGKVLLSSVTGSLMRVLSQGRLEMELELKGLTTPVDELKQKIATFEQKKEDILSERRSFDLLLDGELNRLVKAGLEEDLAAFKDRLIVEMERRFDRVCEEKAESSPRDLDAALEVFVKEAIEKAFTGWRFKEDEKISGAFSAVCARFAKRIDDSVDVLLRFSSELFSVPFEAVSAESLWTAESGFYYKFRDDAVGLEMLDSSLTHLLPGLVTGRFQRLKDWLTRKARQRVCNRRKEQLRQLVDIQSGRVRYDFVERLHKSRTEFRRQMLERIDTTVESIGAAIGKGMDLRARGELEAEDRRDGLTSQILELDVIRDRLVRIREAAGAM